jgi:peptide subunit release factor 1 (eRF1)
LYATYDNVAIVLASGKTTDFYLHSENQTKKLGRIDEKLPNKHRRGGQSAQRFGRIRDEAIDHYIKKIIECMISYYIIDGQFIYKLVVIAGPAEVKNYITDNNVFIQYFGKYLKYKITVAEITDQTITQVIETINTNNTTCSVDPSVDILNDMISNPDTVDLLVFGIDNCLHNLNNGQLRHIYVYNSYANRDTINLTSNKTTIYTFYSKNFSENYGELVGVRYYRLADHADID